MRGVRPNSPMQMTSVVSSSPRFSRSSSSVENTRSSKRSVPVGDQAEVIGVGVPAVVGERDKTLQQIGSS